MMVEDQERSGEERMRVLLIDNDTDITELVSAVLTDEGYTVSALNHGGHDLIATAVGRLEPDCILLDGAGGDEFGDSWTEAAYLSGRSRPIPTIMFTAHSHAVREAEAGTTKRSQAARFTAVLSKPFTLDGLLEAVADAAGRSPRFDRSEAGDRERTHELRRLLTESGATDIRTSERREWATFVSPTDGRIYQLYWWQGLGAYIVGRYDDEARLERIGQFFERDAAIAAALA